MNETEIIQGCLLLMIMSNPSSHGYELRQLLEKLDYQEDGSRIYRTLREMEQKGLVSSEFGPSANGPQRRNYKLTSAGRASVLHFDNKIDYELDHLARIKQACKAAILAR